MPHRVRIQYQRIQGRLSRPRSILFVHTMVGQEEPLVSACSGARARADREGHRTWVLILGMSALIIAFWFIKGGVALRYLVCTPLLPFDHLF